MSARRTRWSPAQARRVVGDLERSGLTLAEFSRARDLHPKRIRLWRKRFDEEAARDAPRMVELVAVSPPTPRTLKLCCPSGHVIEVAGVEITEGVRAMLAALPAATTC